MALPPHSLDDVIADGRDPVAIAKAIADDPTCACCQDRREAGVDCRGHGPARPPMSLHRPSRYRNAILQAIANPSSTPLRATPNSRQIYR